MAGKIEIAKCYISVIPSLEGSQATITKELTGITSTASEKAGDEGGSKFGEKFGAGLKKAAAAVGAATVATTAAAVKGISTLTTQAVKNFGDYEQLVGGVEKLFGSSADTVIKNADAAFKSAGLSANEYMETVTGFSAALINSLGGDTEAAAALADTALQDMADNANVFGSDMESVMTTYQSLSKGQFQTLDNLKLGFAGTKTGAEEMVAAAEKLDPTFKAQRDSTGKLTLAYGDLVKAIHIVQTDMNITGTTSKEAASTIQGSLGMLSASWTNLLTGLGDESADLGTLFDNVIESALTVVDNIQPIATRAVQGIATLIQKIAPVVANNLPQIVNTLMPALTSAVISLISSLSSVLPTLLKTVSDLIIKVLPVFMQMLPTILSSLFDMITALATWLAEGDNVNQIIQGILDLVTLLANQLDVILPVLLPAVVKIIGAVATELSSPENIKTILTAVVLVIKAIVDGIIAAAPDFVMAIYNIGQQIYNTISQFLNWMADLITPGLEFFINKFRSWGETVKNWVLTLITNVKNSFTTWLTNVKTAFSDGFEAIKTKISDVINGIKGFVTDAINTIAGLPDKALSIGKDLISGLWNGISDKTQWVLDQIAGLGTKITNKVKKVFGVASPSKVFAEIGGFLAEGLGVGFDDEIGNVQSDMLKSADGLTASMTGEITAVGTSNTSTVASGNTINAGGNTINVYAAEGQDVNQLAEIISEKLDEMTRRKGAIFA